MAPRAMMMLASTSAVAVATKMAAREVEREEEVDLESVAHKLKMQILRAGCCSTGSHWRISLLSRIDTELSRSRVEKRPGKQPCAGAGISVSSAVHTRGEFVHRALVPHSQELKSDCPSFLTDSDSVVLLLSTTASGRRVWRKPGISPTAGLRNVLRSISRRSASSIRGDHYRRRETANEVESSRRHLSQCHFRVKVPGCSPPRYLSVSAFFRELLAKDHVEGKASFGCMAVCTVLTATG